MDPLEAFVSGLLKAFALPSAPLSTSSSTPMNAVSYATSAHLRRQVVDSCRTRPLTKRDRPSPTSHSAVGHPSSNSAPRLAVASQRGPDTVVITTKRGAEQRLGKATTRRRAASQEAQRSGPHEAQVIDLRELITYCWGCGPVQEVLERRSPRWVSSTRRSSAARRSRLPCTPEDVDATFGQRHQGRRQAAPGSRRQVLRRPGRAVRGSEGLPPERDDPCRVRLVRGDGEASRRLRRGTGVTTAHSRGRRQAGSWLKVSSAQRCLAAWSGWLGSQLGRSRRTGCFDAATVSNWPSTGCA